MKNLRNNLSSKLFYNDKFVMVFSILVAFISWLYVSTTTQEASVFTVTDIPINLPELSDNMRYFNADGLKAEIKISGNALVVTSVTGDDIYITAEDTSKITKPGTYTLELVPKKSGIKTDYSFESSVSPSSIDVFVDEYDEKELVITDKIVVNSVEEETYVSQTVLSQQTVKITGAKSVIDSISEVDAEYTFRSTLSETTVVKAPLVFYDSSGKRVESSYIKSDISEVDATVPVLDRHDITITPKLSNVPSYLSFNSSFISVEPSTIKVAMPKNANISNLFTNEIDFSQLSLENNKFNVGIEIPTGCKNIDGTDNVTVTFDMSGMTTKKVAITKFGFVNQGSSQNVSVSTKTVNLTLLGPKSKLSSIKSTDITAVIDLSEKSTITNGIIEMPLSISFGNNYSDCWVQGSYTVNVSFSAKSGTDNLISNSQ